MQPEQGGQSFRAPQSEYVHWGKAADYTVILLDDGAGPASGQRVTVDQGIKFGEANSTL